MNNQLPRSLRHLVRSIQLRLFYPLKQWGSQPNRNSQLRVFILAVGVVLLLGAFTAQAVRAVYQPGATGSFLGLLSSSNFTFLPVIQVIPPVVTPQTIPHGEGFRGLSPATVAATSALKWQKSLPRGIGYGGITFSGDYQFLYFKTFGAPQGKVFKVRTSDGSTVWETDPAVIGFGGLSESGATIDEAAGRVYTTGSINSLPSGNSIIAALKISDGSPV